MYLAFDIGGTYTKYAWIKETGEILEKGKMPTITNDREEFLKNLVSVYQKKTFVKGIAISCPGRVDTRRGVLYGGGSVKCLDGLCLTEELSRRCGGLPVSVENDGKCAGLAEVWIGAAQEVENCCVIAFGTGIAGAVIQNKNVLHGNHLIAGEFSYLLYPVDRQKMQTKYFGRAYSAVGVVKRAEAMLQMEEGSLTGEKLFELAEKHVPEAEEALEDFYFHVAVQCYNLQYLFDPDLICIGGGISEQSAVTEGIQRYVKKICEENEKQVVQYTMPVIKACRFRNDSNLIGALYHYLNGGAL